MCWGQYLTFQKEVIWYENIEKPVLCYVNDHNPENRQLIAVIKQYNKDAPSPFECLNSDYWEYATPVTQVEASQWVVE